MIKSLSVMISSIMKDVIVTLAVVVVVVYQTVEYHVNYLPNHFVDRYTAIKISRFGVGLLQYLCNTHTMQCRIYVPTAIPTSLSPSYIFSLNSISTYIIHTFTVTEQITHYITHTQRQSFPLQYPQTPFLLHYPHSARISNVTWIDIPTAISTYWFYSLFPLQHQALHLHSSLCYTLLIVYVLLSTLALSLLCIHPIITPHSFCPLSGPSPHI